MGFILIIKLLQKLENHSESGMRKTIDSGSSIKKRVHVQDARLGWNEVQSIAHRMAMIRLAMS